MKNSSVDARKSAHGFNTGVHPMRFHFSGLSLAAVAVCLSACASSPEDIKAAAINPAQFDYMTCAQLADYAAGLTATYKLAADQEYDARTQDAIGYVLLQQPLGQQRHPAIPAEIADLKGRLAALHTLQTSKSCGQQQASIIDDQPATASQ
jgi:hypothetical protein